MGKWAFVSKQAGIIKQQIAEKLTEVIRKWHGTGLSYKSVDQKYMLMQSLVKILLFYVDIYTKAYHAIV